MTVPGLIWIDRVGRRPILLLGSTLMATWLFANAGILAAYGTDPGPEGVGGIKEASVQVSGAASKAVIACSYLVCSELSFSKAAVLTDYRVVRCLIRADMGTSLMGLPT